MRATTAPDVVRPPGPRMSTLASVRAFRRNRIGLLMRLRRDFGDVVYLRVGRYDVYFLAHPDFARDLLVTGHRDFMKSQSMQEAKRILGEGLLTSEGDLHRRQRQLIQPIFHHERIEGYGRVMVEEALRASDQWRDGEPMDLHADMARLTLSIVGRALFATGVDDERARAVGRALTVVLGMFDRMLSPFADTMERLPLPSNRRAHAAQALLDGEIRRLIRERRAGGGGGDDLLSLLLHARQSHGDDGGMSDEMVRDEAMTLFLAGHETTSNALTWTWYLLSQHPETHDRLRVVLEDALRGRPPSVDDLSRLGYLDMVLSEALRLYPPAWAISRRSLVDHGFGDYLAPAGSTLVISPYVMHHDARWFPDPFRFDPERWAPGPRDERPRHAYLPFGAGPRMCIGESFALMELRLVLATLVPRWQMHHVPGHTVAMDPVITLRPKHGMWMTPERSRG